MTLKDKALILIGKLAIFIINFFQLGSASTWPGNIALFFNNNFIRNIVLKNPKIKINLVTGTNGKTTTTSLIVYILKENNYKVLNNSEGANLLNGIASSLIKHCKLNGLLDFNNAVFEVDENSFHLMLEQVNPYSIIILNLFRDQLDRYGETDIIFNKWLQGLKKIDSKCNIYLNGDDPQIYYLGQKIKAKITYFGLTNKFFIKKNIEHDVDSIYCPVCKSKLIYKGITYSHLGDYYCKCGFKRMKVENLEIDEKKYKIQGIFSLYNITALYLLLNNLYSISQQNINKYLTQFEPVFGRQEQIKFLDRYFYIFLSKNPVGLNQSINLSLKKFNLKKENIWFILNDRIPDGKDISWIWDADIEKLNNNYKRIFVSGDRLYDMAIRLKYAGCSINLCSNNLYKSLKIIMKKLKINEKIIVFPTYTSMLELRKILKGKKFE
jgi:UDP-N-acetylmuramyl tripeptide synthase